ncbi:MAG TPA: hypothetical protein VGO90_16265 [Chthoniobacteraceae bacterium]|nr:hypothetical protein [Chthoniobacter sp.]HEV7869244.1 hypothetical protein [Chthoniobacteraceae bacterium]
MNAPASSIAAVAPECTAAPSLLAGATDRVKSIVQRAFGLRRPAPLDEHQRRFVTFCEGQWKPRTDGGEPLLLMHQTEWYPSILAYSYFTNALARRNGQALGSFGFERSARPLNRLFSAFGAQRILGPRELRRHEKPARRLAAEIFRGLRSRRDVANIHVEGIALGDLIYDSYLRYHVCSTADLTDRRLLSTIEDALTRFFAGRELLDRRNVSMLLIDHGVYVDGGVLARLAIERGIPVYHLPYKPAVMLQLDPALFPHHVEGPGSAPAGMRSPKLPLPFHRFREMFAALPGAEQAALRARGRERLQQRLSGQFDFRVLVGGSAYQAATAGERALTESGRPRIAVMLHDFCDAPHAYRDLLFADHYEWTCWLFERAAQSGCDWYAKPHPNSAHDKGKAQLNDRVIGELKARFPHIHFLPPSVSNRQLIEEGVHAVFTGYGTVGHEFAFVGIPVVNAGDNPHINYGFNFHPRSIAELGELVDNAGELSLSIDPEEVAEFAYMRSVHFANREYHTVDFVPARMEESPEAFRRIGSSEILSCVAEEPEQKHAAIEEYLDRVYADRRHVLPA